MLWDSVVKTNITKSLNIILLGSYLLVVNLTYSQNHCRWKNNVRNIYKYDMRSINKINYLKIV